MPHYRFPNTSIPDLNIPTVNVIGNYSSGLAYGRLPETATDLLSWAMLACGGTAGHILYTLSNGNTIKIDVLTESNSYRVQVTFGALQNNGAFITRMVLNAPLSAGVNQKFILVNAEGIKDNSLYVNNYIGDGTTVMCGTIGVLRNNPPVNINISNVCISNNYALSAQTFFGGQARYMGDNSGTGGGEGELDDFGNDDIDFPPLPPSTLGYGIVTAYKVSKQNLKDLAAFLWSDALDVNTLRKLFADPMDSIISLHMLPAPVPVYDTPYNIVVGPVDTGVSSRVIAKQYVRYNMGTLQLPHYYDTALDYSPYTRVSIYLPYIGEQQLNVDEIAGKTLQLVYNIEVLSGALTALLKVDNSVLYQWSGNAMQSIPLTAQNNTGLAQALIEVSTMAAVGAVTGGAGVGVVAPAVASAVATSKPILSRTGSTSGVSGYMSVQTPYLIFEIPRQSLPADYNTFLGYPSNITAILGTLSGYTQVEEIHLDGMSATREEIEEIEQLLKSGVII